MADEFQESDVIFSDRHEFTLSSSSQNNESSNSKNSKRRKKKKKKKSESSSLVSLSCSAPVDIPEYVFSCFAGDDEYCFGDDGEMVPPHVITERRIQGKMAFSVCTGNGRTLKGRDLSRVRNSILRMTGFLEA